MSSLPRELPVDMPQAENVAVFSLDSGVLTLPPDSVDHLGSPKLVTISISGCQDSPSLRVATSRQPTKGLRLAICDSGDGILSLRSVLLVEYGYSSSEVDIGGVVSIPLEQNHDQSITIEVSEILATENMSVDDSHPDEMIPPHPRD